MVLLTLCHCDSVEKLMDDSVRKELERARQRLVDLTLRNRLLNFRPTRRTTISVVDELPGQVWHLLVEQGKKLAFLAREEHELFAAAESAADEGEAAGDVDVDVDAGDAPPAEDERAGGEPPQAGPQADEGEGDAQAADNGGAQFDEKFSLPDVHTAMEAEQEQVPQRYTDLFLQTSMAGEELQTSLIQIERQGRSVIEERGVNLLFLAMGQIEWTDDNHPGRSFRAPLILVPAGLVRTSAKRRFKLVALDDEPVVNPCLVQKLRELRITLPDVPADWREFNIGLWLADVEAVIASQAGWAVHDEMHLGFFSFLKYLMYVDLDPQRWPDDGLLSNPLIRAMGGDAQAVASSAEANQAPPAEALDEQLPPRECFEVLSADASQLQAIIAARNGASLVIEGPPGTGKSQTIANLIAECLAVGKRVLFVSEKMAALEVVKRRLDGVGLGDFCLELHSAKANRRAVTEELGRVLEKGRYRAKNEPNGADKLQTLRRKLNAYVAALHEPLEPLGISPQQTMGRAALLADVPDVLCDLPGSDQWTAQTLGAMKETLDRLGRQLRLVEPIAANPWRGCGLRDTSSAILRAVEEAIEQALSAMDALDTAAGQLASRLGAPAPATQTATARLGDLARMVQDSPDPADRLVGPGVWDNVSDELRTLLQRLGRLVEARKWMKGRYAVESLDEAEWEGIAKRCADYWASVTRWLRPAYWSDRGVLKRYRDGGHRPALAELSADLRKLAETQALQRDLAGQDEAGTKYFDRAWQGPTSDWAALGELADWLKGFRAAVWAGELGDPAVMLAVAGADRRGLDSDAKLLAERLRLWRQAWRAMAEVLALDDRAAFDEGLDQEDFTDLRVRFSDMAGALETLHEWAAWQHAMADCQAGPLKDFTSRAMAQGVEPEVLSLAMEKLLMRLRCEAAISRREPLRLFNGTDHEADALAFAKLDRLWISRTATRLNGLLASERPAGELKAAGSSQLGILQGEVRRKRGGRPIRQILTDAADAIARLKPCFLMSPLSVAQFLAPEGMRFDVVVFDEASQVEPPDALGAIARGRQLVLVGDPKQLPPTTFFSTMGGEGGGGETPVAGAPAGLTDMESILDRGAVVLPGRRLRWHYRSRHDSLIAFSNHEFYNGDLTALPSCHSDTSEMGVSMIYEPADMYDRGRSQTNRAQARRIAEWVAGHARTSPEVSIGVGAFSQRQQQAILDEIERLRRSDESLEGFFDASRPEPFFVKNLETIQGDERDVILLSVGYGKSEPGERLSMNFGPLNQDGGWRRLNVLITRARRRCVVFSSIVGEDFDLSATQARGVGALKRYLDFARSGHMDLPEPEDSEQAQLESALAKAVYNALTERGVRLAARVGCAGYSIDLAVIDEAKPGRYVLGIECDGRNYRDTPTARDRDRIRHEMLEGLGWRLARVWSVDFFRAPHREVDKLMETIELARAGKLQPKMPTSTPAAKAVRASDFAAVEGGPAVPDYEYYSPRTPGTAEEFYSVTVDKLAKLAANVTDVEGPIRRDELVRRVCWAYGFSRTGQRMEDKVVRALAVAVERGMAVVREDFVWPAGMDDPPVRRRGDSDAARDIELICPEEIARAARLVLEAQFGMAAEDLAGQAARLLGFQHAGTKISQRVDAVVAGEVAAGRIVQEGDQLRMPEPPEPQEETNGPDDGQQ